MDNQMTTIKKPEISKSFNDEIIDSGILFHDNCVKSLTEKAITLGFSLDAIKETLKRYFRAANVELSDAISEQKGDLSQHIDEDKFIEQLILYCTQTESSTNMSGNNSIGMNGNLNDFDDVDDQSEFDLNINSHHLQQQLKQQYLRQQQQQQQQIQSKPFQNFFDNDLNQNDYDLSDAASMNAKLSKMPGIKLMQNSQSNSFSSSKSQQQSIQNKYALHVQKNVQEHQEHYQQSMNRYNDKDNLRPIIIDSNNICQYSNNPNQSKQSFNFHRIKAVTDYFEKRNHQIFVIMPNYRREAIMSLVATASPNMTAQQLAASSTHMSSLSSSAQADLAILAELESKNYIYYSPSKKVGTKRIVCDDDKYMIQLAIAKKGVIVSNDHFKSLLNTNEEFRQVIEDRVLMYSFVDETFMPFEDPLGKNGPSLDNFLRFESFTNQQFMKRCPYRKKCTYGSKCKFWHPERGVNAQGGNQTVKTAHQSTLDDAQEQRLKLEAILSNHKQKQQQQQRLLQTNISNADSVAASTRLLEQDSLSSFKSKAFTPSLVQQNPNFLVKGTSPFESKMENERLFGNESQPILRAMGPGLMNVVNKTNNQQVPNNPSASLLQHFQQQAQKNSFFSSKPPITNSFAASSSIWEDIISSSSNHSITNLLNMEKSVESIPEMSTLSLSSPPQSAAMRENKQAAERDDLRNILLKRLNNDKELVDSILTEFANESDVDMLVHRARCQTDDF